jgi:3-carboxy-cis,cis-muconate cycloisomerase
VTTFGQLFVPAPFLDAVSDRAWVQAMLDAEAALARAEAEAGVVPAAAARAIGEKCRAELFDPAALAEAGRATGNPAEPLVRALRREVGGGDADSVHYGATSQDVVDTAAMLVSRNALDLLVGELDRAAVALATLAEEHRSTPLAGRTLLQQAVPTTFGLKAAGWLLAILEAREALARIRDTRLAAQLGGAAGTLSALGDAGAEVLRLFAAELELREPVTPWHTDRSRIAELGGALATAAGSLGKIGLDLILLSQTEVGEVREGAGGASSTMPHKQNPVGSLRARACARLVTGHASVLTASLEQEHERAAGAWQAEWPALSGALALTGGAAAAIADVVADLDVDTERMRENLEVTHGAIVSERVSFALAERHGREAAARIVGDALERSARSGRDLGEELAEDPNAGLEASELASLLDPTTYLGSAEAFVDRVLRRYRGGS